MTNQPTDKLSVELEIKDGNAEVVIGKNRKSLTDFVRDVENAKPRLKMTIANESYTDLDKLEKASEETRRKFQEITKTRLDGGNVGNLTKEIVKTGERARQLNSDITNIKRQLTDPNRKSSISFLTEELRAAEREAELLNQKLRSLPNSAPTIRSARGVKDDLKLTTFQKTNLSYQVNDVLTGLASGQNPTQILAQQGGQIAQIFDPAQAKAFVAAFAPLVAITAAGVAAIALTYKITGDIRKEAERRLKVEEKIQGAINKQIISGQEFLKTLEKQRQFANLDRQFGRFTAQGSVEELTRRRDLLAQLSNLSAKDGDQEKQQRYIQQLLSLDAQINQTGINKTKTADDAFNDRWETWKKSQQNSIEANEKQLIEVKKESEKLLNLRDDLRNTIISNGAERNPFVKLLSDLDEVGRRAEKQFKNLGDVAVKAAVDSSNAAKILNEARFGSNLQSLRFNQDARRLAAQPESFFADFQRRIERVERETAFVSNTNSLNRQIKETELALSFNPNNPRSSEEMQRRFFGDDPSIRNALEDVRGLRGILTDGAGALGKSAVASEVLKVLPPLNELVNALNNPRLAGDARDLLGQRSNALREQREAEKQKFQDFLANQKVAELGKKDAYEALNLLRNSKGLDRQFQLSQFLAITGELGNDLDANLRTGKFNALREAAQNEAKKEQEAKAHNEKIEKALGSIVKALTEKGIIIDKESRGNTTVTVNAKEFDLLEGSPTNDDTRNLYGSNFEFGGASRGK